MQKLPRLRFSTPRKNYPDFVFRLHAKITQTSFFDSTQKLPRLCFPTPRKNYPDFVFGLKLLSLTNPYSPTFSASTLQLHALSYL